MKPAFTFEPDLCTGCEACRVACGNENADGQDSGWRQVVTFNPDHFPALPTLHLSLACNHCDVPACSNGCPARAYYRDSGTGAVLIDADRCIGCRYCSWVCPYDAPVFDEDAGVMTKCTFCVQRLEQGREPACVAACPTGALRIDERPSAALEPAFHGLGAWGLGPALRIVDSKRTVPDGLIPDGTEGDTVQSMHDVGPRKIGARTEKSLIAFTTIVPALAAWFAGGLRLPDRSPPLVAFLAIAGIAFAISASHLGRPLRAWRAILGLRTSWLSREIAATGLFAALAATFLALPDRPVLLGTLALSAALAAVIAMDMVYLTLPQSGSRRAHGAEVTLTFLLLAGIAADVPAVVQALAAATILPVMVRWRSNALGMPRSIAAIRLALLALAVLAVSAGWPWIPAFLVAFASTAIGRAAFYECIEPSTPGARMREELGASLS